MKVSDRLGLGIAGCGAIGSRIAMSTRREIKNIFQVTALYDTDHARSRDLARRLGNLSLAKKSLQQLISSCDVVVEAVNTSGTLDIVRASIRSGRSVMAMSVGRLLTHPGVFKQARRGKASLLLPSGAIAGLDALKAASLAGIDSVVLESRKPPAGFANNQYLVSRGMVLEKIRRPTVLFDGPVAEAVRHFPQNINVAAVISLACGRSDLRVRIVADPGISRNSHEIVMEGPCGRITTRTENTICPDNPKTSYLAVLSGIQMLRQYFSSVKIGT